MLNLTYKYAVYLLCRQRAFLIIKKKKYEENTLKKHLKESLKSCSILISFDFWGISRTLKACFIESLAFVLPPIWT